jgi:phosphopantothenoylcysteine decarboxylase/phosphopantothenate--cysteine ligase
MYKKFEGFPIIALHNRYAVKGTVEQPPRKNMWKHLIFCPVDVTSQGTWIGFNDAGLFAAVTDQHTEPVEQVKRSRGKLIMDVLGNFSNSVEALEYLKRELKIGGYKKGNFILLDKDHGFHVIYDEEVIVREVEKGDYVVSNLAPIEGRKLSKAIHKILKEASVRRNRALKLLSDISEDDVSKLVEKLMSVAKDHEHGLSELSICYHSEEEMETTSSTIVAMGRELKDSKFLYVKGNPCKGEFIDYSYLVREVKELGLKSDKLGGKRIALCLTGSVAVVEAPKLARELRRYGAEVTCFMTESAIKYGLSPKLMEWATKNRVIYELGGEAEHIHEFDLAIIYPATLNTINKIACGIADNAVTTLCASMPTDRILIAPAMNLKLYGNHVLQQNMSGLRRRGAVILSPRIEEGAAKVPPVEEVLDNSIRVLSSSRLRERRVLILTGPTRYELDPVRYISNKATGRIGYWLAKEAFHRGCGVKVIYGPGAVKFPRHIPCVNVLSTEDMLNEALAEVRKEPYDIAIFSAAILDFKPERRLDEKVRSGKRWSIELVPTPKVIKEVRKERPDLFIVAFKLEYNVKKESLIFKAREMMKKYEANLMVANDLLKIERGINEAIILDEGGNVYEFVGTKDGLAKKIMDVIEDVL